MFVGVDEYRDSIIEIQPEGHAHKYDFNEWISDREGEIAHWESMEGNTEEDESFIKMLKGDLETMLAMKQF
jgi:hypothetical protein